MLFNLWVVLSSVRGSLVLTPGSVRGTSTLRNIKLSAAEQHFQQSSIYLQSNAVIALSSCSIKADEGAVQGMSSGDLALHQSSMDEVMGRGIHNLVAKSTRVIATSLAWSVAILADPSAPNHVELLFEWTTYPQTYTPPLIAALISEVDRGRIQMRLQQRQGIGTMEMRLVHRYLSVVDVGTSRA